MNILGIKFAPLNVPLKRRIETLSALYWICTLAFGGMVSTCILLYVILCTQFYWIGLLYIMWIYWDRNTAHQGGRKIWWVRRLPPWHHFRDFFPLKLVKTCDLPPTKNYLFCSYPHGLLPAGIFGHIATDVTEFPQLFPGLKTHLATLNVHFNTPYVRELMLGVGGVAASKESIKHILTLEDKGHVLTLVVGGAEEALYARPGANEIVLKKRKGFVKLALKTGAPMVPVYSFGETELYDQVSNPPGSLMFNFQYWVKELVGIAPCIPIGRGILQYSFGPIPRRFPITTVVGKPIEVPKEENPSSELVDKYHQIFTEELTKLFEEHKHKYVKNPESARLIIN